MPESAISADLLQDILEGRTFANASSPEADLAMLARACRTVRIPGPNHQTETRLALKIRSVVRLEESEARNWWQGWVGGTAQRPLVQKLAAAVMIAGIAGGGTSAATGVSPAEFVQDGGSLIRSIIVNLNPGDGGSPSSLANPSPTPSPDATTTPGAGATSPSTPPTGTTTTQQPDVTPAPTSTPPANSGTPSASAIGGPVASPSASATPDDDDDSPDDDDDDDNSGSSSNSGSGSGSRPSDDSPEDEDD